MDEKMEEMEGSAGVLHVWSDWKSVDGSFWFGCIVMP